MVEINGKLGVDNRRRKVPELAKAIDISNGTIYRIWSAHLVVSKVCLTAL